MDYLSTVTIADAFIWAVIVGIGYTFGIKRTKERIVPKYKPGQCIVFEYGTEKQSGVIVRSETVDVEACRQYYPNDSLQFYHNQFVRYLVDTKHAKYNDSIHRHAGCWLMTPNGMLIDTDDVELVWIKEENIGCIV